LTAVQASFAQSQKTCSDLCKREESLQSELRDRDAAITDLRSSFESAELRAKFSDFKVAESIKHCDTTAPFPASNSMEHAEEPPSQALSHFTAQTLFLERSGDTRAAQLNFVHGASSVPFSPLES